MSRKHIIASGAVILVLLFLRIVSSPVNTLEQGLLDMRYHVRGQVPADTNIVILYFDNDDISSLGGFPLKRNIYALLTNVLTKSGAKAIAFDIVFADTSIEYSEHDDLFAGTAAASGRVIFSSYFDRVDTKELSSPTLVPNSFPALAKMSRPVLFGTRLQLPYPKLLQAAAGIGHLNTTVGSPLELPLLFEANGRSVPAFGLEVLRVFAGVDRSKVRLEDNAVSLPVAEGIISVPMTSDGTTSLNMPGPLSSFRHYSCVEVLQSFANDSASLSTLRGKVVFVSVIGAGRGNFVATPFDGQFPAVGLHATLIDNALQGRFLKRVNPFVGQVLVPVILCMILIVLIQRFGNSRGGVFAVHERR